MKISSISIRKIGHLNIKTKMLDIEVHVLIGRYLLASQSEHMPTHCLYVKAYLLYGKYIYPSNIDTNESYTKMQ